MVLENEIKKMNLLSVDEKIELIAKNLQEIEGEDVLKKIVAARPLKIYWGTATTGKPHIGYFVPLLKIRDFLKAGCEITVLLADIHAFLDNLKAPVEKIQLRTIYYEKIILSLLKSLNVDTSLIKFVKGSDFQLDKNYTFDLYKMSSFTTIHDTVKAGSQVVKQCESPLLSSLLYPNMQCLDEEYLKVDAQFGGVDQRKIFMHSNKYLPKLGYKRRIHLMNRMMPGLSSEKMSSSDENSKINLCDSESTIKKKIKKCFCEEGNLETGVLTIFKYIVFEVFPEGVNVGNIKYSEYSNLEADFEGKKIHPSDLKECAAFYLNKLIEPIRNEMEEHADIAKKAYN